MPAVQQLWDRLSQARNQYAHAGFKRTGLPDDGAVDRWLQELTRRVPDDDFWSS